MARYALLLLITLTLSSLASAQVLQQNLPQAEKSRWGGFVSASASSNFEDAPGLRQTGVSGSLALDYKLDGQNTIRFSTGVNHRFEEQRRNVREEYQLTDSFIAWRHPYSLSDSVFMLADARLTIPTSENSNERDDIYTRTTVRPLFVFNLDKMGVLKNSALIYIPGYTHTFNQFDVSVMGNQLVRDQIFQVGVFEYYLPYNFTLNIGASYAAQWSETGFRMDDTFSSWQEIIYAVNKDLRVSLGHSNAGSIYEPNGRNNNIELYDFDTSSFYVSTLYLF
jgi:hypothetical protein